jgi:hypothetical protein
MKHKFPLYFRDLRYFEVVKVDEDGWTSIRKDVNDDYQSVRFEVHSRRVKFTDDWFNYWQTATQEDYNNLKFEFLNWVDKTFER